MLSTNTSMETEREAQFRKALERLASKETFTVAFDANHAPAETIWHELQARGKFAEDVLCFRVLLNDG